MFASAYLSLSWMLMGKMDEMLGLTEACLSIPLGNPLSLDDDSAAPSIEIPHRTRPGTSPDQVIGEVEQVREKYVILTSSIVLHKRPKADSRSRPRSSLPVAPPQSAPLGRRYSLLPLSSDPQEQPALALPRLQRWRTYILRQTGIPFHQPTFVLFPSIQRNGKLDLSRPMPKSAWMTIFKDLCVRSGVAGTSDESPRYKYGPQSLRLGGAIWRYIYTPPSGWTMSFILNWAHCSDKEWVSPLFYCILRVFHGTSAS
jgi:hypothetical protein